MHDRGLISAEASSCKIEVHVSNTVYDHLNLMLMGLLQQPY